MNDFTYLIPIGDTLSKAWEKVKGSKLTFILAYLYPTIIIWLLSSIPQEGFWLSLIIIFGQILTILLFFGLFYMGIVRAFDLPLSVSQVFHPFERSLNFKALLLILLEILILFFVALILLIPFILLDTILSIQIPQIVGWALLLIPLSGVIYVIIRLHLAPGLVLDKELGPWDAIKKSMEGTRNNFWRLFAIMLLQFVINIIGAIPLGIGLIWTIPFSFILYGIIYKTLLVNVKTF